MKTNIEAFTSFRRHAEQIARTNEMNTVIYVSGTKNKKTYFEKMIEKYEADSKLDFELGINETREIEQKAYVIMVNSVARFEIY